ncbi:MAG: hypothetical protein H6606_04395 [Flavobacteriales bacterium]|nr:hypothetical protein [Flavobacteriales bacterium]
MSSVVINRRISVRDGMRLGIFHLQWLPLLVIGCGFGAAAYFKLMLHDEAGPAVLWSLFATFSFALIYYSFAAPLWRLWAFPLVDNPNKLQTKALANKIIWPKGHFMYWLEWKLWGFRKRVQHMEDEVQAKIERIGPVHIRQFGDYYELKVGPQNIFRDTLMVIVGCTVLFGSIAAGLVIILFFGSMALWSWLHREDLMKYLRIDVLGVTHDKRFVPWQNVRNWLVEPIGTTAASFKLTLLLHEETVFIELATLSEYPLDLEFELEGYYQLHREFNNYDNNTRTPY